MELVRMGCWGVVDLPPDTMLLGVRWVFKNQMIDNEYHAHRATPFQNLLNGLVAKPELNGRTGTAVSFDDATGRYSVELDGTSSSLMIKPCNLLPTVCSVALCSLLFSHV